MTSVTPATVGELFPADDVVAQWVFSLSAVAEDLSIMEAVFQRLLRDGGAPPQTGYYYRQVIARLYEAERPIITARQRDDVRQFVAGVTAATEHIDYLAEQYTAPADGEMSKVRATFGGTRHRTLHHSWAGSPELREALEVAADEDARILVNHRAEWLHYEWPEAVVLRSLLGDLTEPAKDAALRENLEFAQTILRHLVALTKAMLAEHVRRRGIELARLIVEVGDDSDAAPESPSS